MPLLLFCHQALDKNYFYGRIKLIRKANYRKRHKSFLIYYTECMDGIMRLEEYGVTDGLSQMIVDYIEEIRELLSLDLWDNIFLNSSKNEVFIFWLLYQRGEVNMTEIAEYIHVPLNTATGIVSRMEKNGLVVRSRSREDKRVVNIAFSEKGMEQLDLLMKELVSYGMKVLGSFTREEMELFYKMTSKIMEILRTENKKEKAPKKVRRIPIE